MAEHIKTIIDKYLQKNKQKQKEHEKIKKILKETLKAETVKHLRIEPKPNKKIVFFLRSSSAVYELRLQKGKIEKKIKQNFPAIKGVDIEVE
ncbi:MAG: hypothetical protein K9L84_01400 [Candidatus Omnitrophica bacterium]|nr:hypothetical protein [Candidatus Omnitrophota bacterium]MCF7893704.1 hypothetical protein [Candidatus Omnitrophota bacterium]